MGEIEGKKRLLIKESKSVTQKQEEYKKTTGSRKQMSWLRKDKTIPRLHIIDFSPHVLVPPSRDPSEGGEQAIRGENATCIYLNEKLLLRSFIFSNLWQCRCSSVFIFKWKNTPPEDTPVHSWLFNLSVQNVNKIRIYKSQKPISFSIKHRKHIACLNWHISLLYGKL